MKTIPWSEGSDLEGTSMAQIWEWDTDESTIHVRAVSSPAQIIYLSQNEGFVGSLFRVYRERAVTTTLFIIYYLSLILYFVLGNIDQLTMTYLSTFKLSRTYVLVVLFNSGNWQLGTGREVKVFLHC